MRRDERTLRLVQADATRNGHRKRQGTLTPPATGGADGPRSRGGSPGCQPAEGLGCHQEAAGMWQTQAHGEGGWLAVCEAELIVRGGGHCLAA